MKYIAMCSGGKDSVATLILAKEHNEPLDEVVYCEVMFTKDISGEIPEHRDFIYNTLKPWVENVLGVPFVVVRSEKSYDDVFHHRKIKGKNVGKKLGFVFPGRCDVAHDCKLRGISRYAKKQDIQYLGIANDEIKRLRKIDSANKISLLAKYGISEAEAVEICRTEWLLSPIYQFTKRGGCFFCPNQKDSELKHLIEYHPDLFDKLIEWGDEDNVYHSRMTRTETPQEIKDRLEAETERGIEK